MTFHAAAADATTTTNTTTNTTTRTTCRRRRRVKIVDVKIRIHERLRIVLKRKRLVPNRLQQKIRPSHRTRHLVLLLQLDPERVSKRPLMFERPATSRFDFRFVLPEAAAVV